MPPIALVAARLNGMRGGVVTAPRGARGLAMLRRDRRVGPPTFYADAQAGRTRSSGYSFTHASRPLPEGCGFSRRDPIAEIAETALSIPFKKLNAETGSDRRADCNGELLVRAGAICGVWRAWAGPQLPLQHLPKSAAEQFAWTAGTGNILWYESSPGTHRGFCGKCGTRLVSRIDATPDSLGVPLALFDDDPGVRPERHVHVGSKAPWVEISDDLPQIR